MSPSGKLSSSPDLPTTGKIYRETGSADPPTQMDVNADSFCDINVHAFQYININWLSVCFRQGISV